MAFLIVLASVKGGVSKSTLARALAVEAVRNSVDVMLCDSDLAQGTCLDWSRRRVAAGLRPEVKVQPVKTVAQALSAEAELVILDTPGRAHEGTQKLAEAADLFIQPASPSLDDLIPGVRLFQDLTRQKVKPAKLFFALTNVLTDAEETAGREFIAEAGFQVFEGSIPARASLRDAQNGGRAIQECRFPAINARIDVVLQAIIDKVEL